MGGPSGRERPRSGLVTERLRELRGGIERRLATLESEIGALGGLPEDARRASMRRVAAEIEASLRPHLGWEERTIHPIVDKYACEGPAVFSSSMRYEHEIIYRWIAELKELAEDDTARFVRRADNLLGVVSAHFELEQHVFFPILDRYVNPTDAAWAMVLHGS